MKRAMYSILPLLMFVLLSVPIYAESSDRTSSRGLRRSMASNCIT